MADVARTITAQNQYTDSIEVAAGNFSVSLVGTFSMTVTVQFSEDNGVTWADVQDFTEPGRWTGWEGSGGKYRIGCKTGNYTSGSVFVKIKE